MVSDDSVERSWASMDDESRSLYGREYLKKSAAHASTLCHALAGNPTNVVDAIEHALTARYGGIISTICCRNRS